MLQVMETETVEPPAEACGCLRIGLQHHPQSMPDLTTDRAAMGGVNVDRLTHGGARLGMGAETVAFGYLARALVWNSGSLPERPLAIRDRRRILERRATASRSKHG